MVGGTLVKLASAAHKVAKYYYHGPKRSSNKIQILKTKFEFGKKTNLTSLIVMTNKHTHTHTNRSRWKHPTFFAMLWRWVIKRHNWHTHFLKKSIKVVCVCVCAASVDELDVKCHCIIIIWYGMVCCTILYCSVECMQYCNEIFLLLALHCLFCVV